jgi:hypothetical protein
VKLRCAPAKGLPLDLLDDVQTSHRPGGAVRKGERVSLTVYTISITRTRISEVTGEELFNAEQIDGLAVHYTARLEPVRDPVSPNAATQIMPRLLEYPQETRPDRRKTRHNQSDF